MWVDGLLTDRTARAVELTAAFAEQRHRVLAENVANIDTPDYHTQRLDPQAFQKSLKAALAQNGSAGESKLELRGNAQFATNAAGNVEVRPDVEPASNILFHDGTNALLERTVGEVNENSLLYELSTTWLRARYQTLLSAIRGRVS